MSAREDGDVDTLFPELEYRGHIGFRQSGDKPVPNVQPRYGVREIEGGASGHVYD
jgi:hypothetical protein